MAIQKYADEVMADGPVGYWRLGEPRGSTTAADTSGNGHNGSVTGSVTFGLPGFHGGDTAALFDGVTGTGRIVVPNSDTLNPQKITMEAKVRWDGPNGFQQRILEKSFFVNGAQAEYSLSIIDDEHVRVELRAGGGPSLVTSTAVIARNVETHLAATYDGNMIRIYINGALKTKQAASFPGDIQAAEFSSLGISNQAERDRPFNGLIDEVAIFPTALSEERIRAHYQAQFQAQEIFQYAAKFVCGKSAGEVVAPGVYFTAVNVHNPTYSTIGLRVKVAVALPGLQAGPVSKFYDVKLGPDEALEIDCPDIFNPDIFKFNTPMKARFLKGFVVIKSGVELDVVAVYTAAGREKYVETLHMERVAARHWREVCVDFEPPFTVGTQYGAPAGNLSGDVILNSNGVAVSVHDFIFQGGGGTFNVASIDAALVPFGLGQSMRVNNINLEFDFSAIGFTPSEVRFEFLDLGGFENFSVNGSPILAGELSSVPSSIGGVNISVSTTPVAGGQIGTVTLTGAVQKLRVGGQEFWIDNVCARE